MSNDVSVPSIMYNAMKDDWLLPRTLLGGTKAMRAAGKKYLPQEPKETDEAYKDRLDRTTLYNGFTHAVRNLAGKLLSKGAKVKDATPQQIKDLLDNVDLKMRNLNTFVKDVVEDAMAVGKAHILVEYPRMDTGAAVLSVAEEKAIGIRPYLIHLKAENVIGWKVEKINNIDKLTQVRIVESVMTEDPNNKWVEKETIQVRVLYPGRWEVWRQKEKVEGNEEKWYISDSGVSTIKDEIPFVTIYTRRTGFMEARPPLEDLAYMNVAHWQSSSDQRHILHVARVPILFGTGLDEDQGKIEIGPNRLIKGPQGSSLSYVEHTGSAIRAGAQDVESIEAKMSVLSLQPVLQDKPGTQTATARSLDTAEAQSVMRTVVENIADAISTCFWYMGQWMKIEGDCGGVMIESDNLLTLTDTAGLQELGAARTRGDVSRTAYLNELKRRSILAEDYDAEEDQNILDQEVPPLGVGGTTGGMNDGSGNKKLQKQGGL